MSDYSDKMQKLRKSTEQALDEPKPTYRVMSADPKGGSIDDQYALIESEYNYGAPASDPSMRKIRVGDSLPEGEVTAITSEGIQVIPDVGDEYVIPLGGRPGYKPPSKPVKAKSPMESILAATSHITGLTGPFYTQLRQAEEEGLNETYDSLAPQYDAQRNSVLMPNSMSGAERYRRLDQEFGTLTDPDPDRVFSDLAGLTDPESAPVMGEFHSSFEPLEPLTFKEFTRKRMGENLDDYDDEIEL